MTHEHTPRPKLCWFPWIFKIEEDYVCQTGWKLDKDFDSEWLHISKSGKLTVRAGLTGYAWDGCSPKLSVFNLFVLGTPDGHVDHRTMKPFTYNASLVHDALYQYLHCVPVSKACIDRLFLKMLEHFKLRWIYYFAVRCFGGWGIVQWNLP